MSPTPRRHPRDELRPRRTGSRLQVYIPAQLDKLVDAAAARFGTSKKQVVVSALTAYFSAGGDQHDLRDVLKLAKTWLARANQREGT